MNLSIATWNINSVRLRIGLVERFLKERAPDVLCLQETKCPQGQFPTAAFKALGYAHIVEYGQAGYNGVAIASRLPVTAQKADSFCGKDDCRHVSAEVVGVTIHSLYIPAGGDIPDPATNPKFAHKLAFLDELHGWCGKRLAPKGKPAVVVGDLNVAPYEHDVWSHKQLLKIVSHTPAETEALERARAGAGLVDVMRKHVPMDRKLYTWWSYRAKDWLAADRGRRLDHVWASPELASRSLRVEVAKEARGWAQPSDHVPVLAEFAIG